MGVEAAGSNPRTFSASAASFLEDFAQISGRRGFLALLLIIAGAILEGASISLLVPVLALIFGTGSMPDWVKQTAAAGFALFGAHTVFARLLLLFAVFGFMMVLRAIVLSARDIVIFELQLGFVETQQLRIAERLAAAKWDYLAGFHHSRLTHLMNGDMQRLGVGTQFVLLGTTAAVMVAAQWALAFVLAPGLAAMLLAALIAGGFAFGPVLSRARAIGGHVEDASLSLLNSTTQFLGGLKLAMSQDLQTGYIAEIGETLRHLRGHQVRFLKQRVLSQAGISVLFGFFGVAAVIVGLFWLEVAPSLLVTLLLIVTRMTGPLGQVQQGAQQFARVLAVHERIKELERELAACAKSRAPKTGVAYPAGEIVVDNVTVRHAVPDEGHRKFAGLRNAHLTIAPGECLAVTGASGAGKTTLADILAGLYPAQSGCVAVGGKALEGPVLTAWRKGLSYVSQDAFLFYGTIRSNLAWANPEAGEAEMWQALEAVGADRVVRRDVRGLDAVVGERGTLLSGGERQRVALARAILRRPRLLLLDEATSALDAESEREIFQSVRTLAFTPTIVLIAHRTENLDLCDRIIRLEHGRIVLPQHAGQREYTRA